MGAPDVYPKTQKDPRSGEFAQPRHEVRISKPFYLGVHEVTQADYEEVTGQNFSFSQGSSKLPVDSISWFNAIDFCNRLSVKENRSPYYKVEGTVVSILGGEGYRLPTEAEWEYACRGGSQYTFIHGNRSGGIFQYAWTNKNSLGQTHHVGQKPANRFGLHDMIGNVSEWCWDWRGAYSDTRDIQIDPTGPQAGLKRVNRGGAYVWIERQHMAPWHRGWYRDRHGDPDSHIKSFGVRVAWTIPLPKPSPQTPINKGGVSAQDRVTSTTATQIANSRYSAGAGKLPEELGWTFINDDPNTGSVKMNSGSLVHDAPGAGRSYWAAAVPLAENSADGGLFLETVAKVVHEKHTSVKDGVVLLEVGRQAASQLTTLQLIAQDDRIFVLDGKEATLVKHDMDTTDGFHKYRLELHDETLWLFVDDELKETISMPDLSVTDSAITPKWELFAKFGDLQKGSSQSLTEYKQVSFGDLAQDGGPIVLRGINDFEDDSYPANSNPLVLVYDASTNELPRSAGWNYVDNNAAQSTAQVESGILVQDAQLLERTFWEATIPTDRAPADSGVFFETTAQIRREMHTNPKRGVNLIEVREYSTNATRGVTLYAHEDGLLLFNGNDKPLARDKIQLNTTDTFHTYRVELKGNQYWLYVDGNVKASGVVPVFPVDQEFLKGLQRQNKKLPQLWGIFGDNTSSSAALVERKNVIFGSLAALGGPTAKRKSTDYDQLLTGYWQLIPFLNEGEPAFEGTSVNQGVATLQGEKTYRIGSRPYRDIIIRAEVKKHGGWHPGLTVRGNTKGNYSAYFDKFNRFGIGKHVSGPWQDLQVRFTQQEHHEYFEWTLAAVGDRLTVYVDGEKIIDVPDTSHKVGFASFGVKKSKTEFRNLQIMDLTNGPFRPPAIERQNSSVTNPTSELKPDEESFRDLFNGKNLDGWLGDESGFAVEGGNLICRAGTKGNLYTAREYDDFTLQFDFKLTPAANNGIGLRTPLTGDPAYEGLEIQILDDSANQYRQIAAESYHGSLYGVVAAKRGHLKKVGQWNTQEIVCIGNHLKITLNGSTILDIEYDQSGSVITPDGKAHPGLKRRSGHIALLGNNSRVEFRNLRIREGRQTASTTTSAKQVVKNAEWIELFNGKDLSGWVKRGHGEWNVTADALTGTASKGVPTLNTVQEFGDYELQFDYRLSNASRGCVILHDSKSREGGVGIKYVRVNLVDNETQFPHWKDKQRTKKTRGPRRNGGIAQFTAPGNAVEFPVVEKNGKPAGEWNRMLIRSEGLHVTVMLNDRKIASAQIDQTARFKKLLNSPKGVNYDSLKRVRGSVGFLIQDKTIQFRNIRIRELGAKEDSAKSASASISSTPDYAELANGKWLPLLRTREEFEKLRVSRRGTGETDTSHESFSDGEVDLSDETVHGLLESATGRDMIIRARMKRLGNSGNIGLTLRNRTTKMKSGSHYVAWMMGNGDFRIAGHNVSDQANYARNISIPGDYSDWFELAFACVGNRLTLYLNGRQILETEDDSLQRGFPTLMANMCRCRFKEIDYQLLDAPQEKELSTSLTSLIQDDDFATWKKIGSADWKYSGGALTSPGGSKNLLTSPEVRDRFLLEFEYRFQSGTRAGVGLYLASAQAFDEGVGQFDFEKKGLPLQNLPGKAFYVPLSATQNGEWNQMQIRAVDGAVVLAHHVNGLNANWKWRAAKKPAGHLGFHCSGYGVEFRNLRIRNLTAEEIAEMGQAKTDGSQGKASRGLGGGGGRG